MLPVEAKFFIELCFAAEEVEYVQLIQQNVLFSFSTHPVEHKLHIVRQRKPLEPAGEVHTSPPTELSVLREEG